ncbi:MAG: hypothetical protein FJ006_05315 [Chloroflexi bacterium]|nr:hypothetical protein [Chloroflexota bacterium]
MSAVRGFFSGVFCFLLFDVLIFLGLIITLNLTLLNPDFVTTELDKLDVYSVVIEQAKGMLPDQQFIDAETVDAMLTELKPWLEQQATTACKSLQTVANFGTNLSTLLATPFEDFVRTIFNSKAAFHQLVKYRYPTKKLDNAFTKMYNFTIR